VHELRTPLSTLDMNLALLRRMPELAASELLERCEVMGRQTAQLTKLVDELMDAASVSQGKVQLRKTPFELNALVTSAVEMTGGAVAAKAHDLKVRLYGEPLWVEADATRLRQVICNLLVARHGGEVDVASDGPDKGSTFTVTLPLIPQPAG
ncbi:MAG: sensor histidine kinase, partial [Burkholderiales bacterium]